MFLLCSTRVLRGPFMFHFCFVYVPHMVLLMRNTTLCQLAPQRWLEGQGEVCGGASKLVKHHTLTC